MELLGGIAITLALLKIFGIIEWSWAIVLIPEIIGLLLYIHFET